MTNAATVDAGVERLNALLPLADRHAALDPDAAAVHREILGAFLRTGEAPTDGLLRRALPGIDVASARSRLVDADLAVTVDGRTVGAYPFRSDSDDPRVVVDGVKTGAMCSVDALAIGALTGAETSIRSRCPETGREIRIEMADGIVVSVDPPEPVVGIRSQDPGSCAAATLCRDMVFLADEGSAARWAEGTDAGLYGLTDAVEFADRFFRAVMSPALDAR